MTSLQSWKDLGSHEAIDGEADDFEYCMMVLRLASESLGRVSAAMTFSERPLEWANGLDDMISDARAALALAEEAKSLIPGPDATEGERERYGRSRREGE